MKKYKITLDKQKCSGCLTCHVVCEKIFKPDITGKVSISSEEITEENFLCVDQAIKACPMGCIKIKEIK